ncbi:MAG: S9 family peptidase, partial [Cellvibrionales bacterium]|nr:S9 family peptidase [Cellvibrionales bacterium]
AVAEDHSDSNAEPLASLIAISANAQTAPHTLQSGADFYSTPRLSPDGNDLLWLQWNHPDMPWTRNELWYAPLNAPAKAKKLVAGDESIFQPQFSPTGRIHYVSDRNNWWNLYEYRPAAPDRCLVPAERECGLPQWQFGMSTWGFIAPDKILAAYSANGTWSLYQLNLTTGKEHKIAADYNYLSHLATDPASGRALIIAASPQQPEHLCTVKTTSKTDADKTEKIRPLFTDHPPQSPVSQAQSITFAAANGTPVHGFFYPPHNAAYRAPPDDRPPLLVLCHGGPTAATNAAFNLAIQFWTSRGFAVTDINYRGSTGFGRAYRLSLDGHWGIYDVADACAAAEYCAAQGWVARDKCIIRGSSAGGYTVLSALCFHNTFAAGCSRYGIGDLKALAADTHKFESRYTDRLIAPPTDTATYAARSPINHVEKFSCPTLFFQGLKDRVVPPEQSKKMATALKKAGFPVCLITYPDEAHGFRNAPNITHALNTELAFYGTVFGIKTDSPITNLKIANLPTTRPKPAS